MGVTRVRHPYIENVVEVEKRACHVHVSVPHLEKERAFIWKLCLWSISQPWLSGHRFSACEDRAKSLVGPTGGPWLDLLAPLPGPSG